MKSAREKLLEAVKKDGYELGRTDFDIRHDREIVLAAVSQSGVALQFASDGLRGNREVVLAAVTQRGWALEYASDELKGDRGLVLAAVNKDGDALRHASDELRADREIVLAAVNQNGHAIEFTSKELQGDINKEGSLKNYLCNAIKESTSSEAFRNFLQGMNEDGSKSQDNKLPSLKKMGRWQSMDFSKQISEYGSAQVNNNFWKKISGAAKNLGMNIDEIMAEGVSERKETMAMAAEEKPNSSPKKPSAEASKAANQKDGSQHGGRP